MLADQTRIMQLAVNLVDNALKYTPSGGNVTISAATEGDWGAFRVIDTGIGIAAEHLPHLFERFYRVDKARARSEGGAGLGLAICYWIAESHGGMIAVDSPAEPADTQPPRCTGTTSWPQTAPRQLGSSR